MINTQQDSVVKMRKEKEEVKEQGLVICHLHLRGGAGHLVVKGGEISVLTLINY